MEGVADFAFHPTSPQLAVLTDTGSVRIHTLDTGELVELAGSRMQRSYPSEECLFYRIDPCPTLDEIKTG